jgi:hypothetical protein
MTSELDLADLEKLYSILTTAERDELLQAILIAASRGEDQVTHMLEAYCVVCAGRELIADFARATTPANPVAIQSKQSLSEGQSVLP